MKGLHIMLRRLEPLTFLFIVGMNIAVRCTEGLQAQVSLSLSWILQKALLRSLPCLGNWASGTMELSLLFYPFFSTHRYDCAIHLDMVEVMTAVSALTASAIYPSPQSGAGILVNRLTWLSLWPSRVILLLRIIWQPSMYCRCHIPSLSIHEVHM